MNPPGAVAPAAWLRDRRAAILLLVVGLQCCCRNS